MEYLGSKRARELVALLLLSFGCLGTVNNLWFFIMVHWAGLQCVIWHFLFILSYLFEKKISFKQLNTSLFSCSDL